MSAVTDDRVRLYVWELPVRLTHWLIALSILTLAVTGIYIGRPFLSVSGEATNHFVMGRMKLVHTAAAIVFTLSVLTRILWMLVGNRYASIRELVPLSMERVRGAWKMFRFYVFLRRDPPVFVGHNPLAGFAYTAVFALYLLQIASGFALYSASAQIGSPMASFDVLIPLFGGLQGARLVHHVGMWLILGFVAHHVWSAILVSFVERNGLIDSIFSGFKHVPASLVRNASEKGKKS
jgi:Ni/Fe-hydrogenase 1 B-type cytochrome subunit